MSNIQEKFDIWFEESDGFSYRSELFWDDFYYASKSGDTQGIRKWLQDAYEMGYNDARQCTEESN
jgi:hypothetical protein